MKNEKLQPSLLLGVFCCESARIPEKSIQTQKSYPELYDLREQIEIDRNGPHHRPYSANKKRVMAYQGIFLGFSLVFLTLAGLMCFKTTNWTCSLLFGNFMMIKTFIITLSLFLFLSSMWVALSMRTEREAINHLTKRAKKRLSKMYDRLKAELGITSFYSFSDPKALCLKHLYREARDKIEDRREETLLLFSRIKDSKDVDPEIKEDLYNQAILEFHDQLYTVILAFKHTAI